MNKVYNTQEEIATKLKNFLLECFGCEMKK